MNIPPVKANLLLTDPPYNIDYKGGTNKEMTIQNDNMDNVDFGIFLKKAFDNADRHLEEGGAFYVWHASKTQKEFQEAMTWEIRQQLVWVKNNFVLGRQDYQWKHEICFYGWKEGAAHYFKDSRIESTVIEDKPNINKMNKDELKEYVKELLKNKPATTVIEEDKPTKNGEHPTMKPVKLIAYQMGNSTKKHDIVLDLFGGSGTTLIAAEQLGRKCRILELDEKYADVIVKRYEALTGQKGMIC